LRHFLLSACGQCNHGDRCQNQTYATFRHSYLSSLLGSHPLSMFSTNLASNFAISPPGPIPASHCSP
jgi:hypothetical protein